MATMQGTPVELKRAELGQYGATFISDTAVHAGDWYAIQVVADATFNALTDNWDGNTNTGVAFSAGAILYGHFTSIDLTSGSVIAYKTPLAVAST